MDAKLVNPFIQAVFNCIETMAGIKPKRLAPYMKGDALAKGDITGIIAFAGQNIIGSVALSFPVETALFIYDKVTGEKQVKISREVMDLTGELANIIAGGVKQEFAKEKLSFHISIPTIIVGKNHSIHHQLDTPILVIPFEIEENNFMMEVTLKISKMKA